MYRWLRCRIQAEADGTPLEISADKLKVHSNDLNPIRGPVHGINPAHIHKLHFLPGALDFYNPGSLYKQGGIILHLDQRYRSV